MNPKDRVDIFNKISKLIGSKRKAKRVIGWLINKALTRKRELELFSFDTDEREEQEYNLIDDIHGRLNDMHYVIEGINNRSSLKVSISKIFILYVAGLQKILHFQDVIGDPKRYDVRALDIELKQLSKQFFNNAKYILPQHPNDTYNYVFYALSDAGIGKDDVTTLLESYKVTSSGKKAKWSKRAKEENKRLYYQLKAILDSSNASKEDYQEIEELLKPFK